MKISIKNKISFAVVLIAVLTLFPACGKGRIKTEGVVGTITLDGAPLANATVKFVPTEGSTGSESYGTTNEKGEYKLQTLLGAADAGTTPGQYGIAFECFEEYETGRTTTNADDQEVPETESRSVLPERYNNPKTSGFDPVEVVKGKNKFDFALESK